MNHGLVIDREKLFADDLGCRIEASSGATGKNDTFSLLHHASFQPPGPAPDMGMKIAVVVMAHERASHRHRGVSIALRCLESRWRCRNECQETDQVIYRQSYGSPISVRSVQSVNIIYAPGQKAIGIHALEGIRQNLRFW